MVAHIILTLAGVIGLFVGYQQWICFENLTRKKVLILFSSLVLVIVASGLLTTLNVIHRSTAELVTAGLYLLFAGFFLGTTSKLFVFLYRSGPVEYRQSNTLIRFIPNLLALLIIGYGIYRTHLFSPYPIHLLSWSSGTSLICFGIYGWRLKVIPEFRERGLLILDQRIPWQQMIGYEWHTEESICIEYRRSSEHISEIKTGVPSKDQLFLERLLRNKMDEYSSLDETTDEDRSS